MEFCQLPLVPGKEVTDRKEEDEEEMNFENFYRWSLNVSTVAEHFEVWNYLSVCSKQKSKRLSKNNNNKTTRTGLLSTQSLKEQKKIRLELVHSKRSL